MNNIVETNIQNMIYEIRGKQVILDSDLAKLYGCKNGTKDINKAVKRNLEKFPDDFYFQVSLNELEYLRFQNGTTKMARVLPHVFTEQGVSMLATVLKTEKATRTSINIMRAFVAMRHFISSDLIEQHHINNMVLKHDNEIKLLQETFDKFKPNNNHIFFEGQIYDAYSLMLDIFESSKSEIIIIDNYADKKLLDLLSKTKKKIKVYSKNISEELIKKYLSQYDNVKIIENNGFHDRFIITDRKELYHCGASFKELGKKCFALSKIEDKEILDKVLTNLY